MADEMVKRIAEKYARQLFYGTSLDSSVVESAIREALEERDKHYGELLASAERYCDALDAKKEADERYNRQIDACGDMGSNSGVDTLTPELRRRDLEVAKASVLAEVVKLGRLRKAIEEGGRG